MGKAHNQRDVPYNEINVGPSERFPISWLIEYINKKETENMARRENRIENWG